MPIWRVLAFASPPFLQFETLSASLDSVVQRSQPKAGVWDKLCRLDDGSQGIMSEPLLTSLFAGAASRHLKAGEALLVAGALGEGCYRVEQGLLKVFVTSSWGEERILAMLGPGQIVGELVIIDGGPRCASVVAVRDCELSFISRAAFGERAVRHPEIYQHLIKVLAARVRQADEEVAVTSFLTVQARLARTLLDLGKHIGEDDGAGHVVIRHKICLSDLAAMAGVARENVRPSQR